MVPREGFKIPRPARQCLTQSSADKGDVVGSVFAGDYYKYKVTCEMRIARSREVSETVTRRVKLHGHSHKYARWENTLSTQNPESKREKKANHGFGARSSEGSEGTTPVYRFRFLTGLEAVAATFERVRGNAPFLGPF